MKHPIELWVYLSASPLLWLTLTLFAWILATTISVRLKRHPLANPVLITIAVLSTTLWLFDVPYETFFEGAQFIHFLLGPATVAIAIPLYRQWQKVRQALIPMAAALVVGSFSAVLSIVLMGKWVGLSQDVLVSFLPKSATAGVAMAISSSLGGNPSLTAVLVVLTGIVGALVVTPLMNAMRIKDYAARGFAVGLTSHGIGTARAFDVDETAGLFAGIAMALNAIATSLIVPLLVRLVL
ncbi:LrgB family protein [Aminobacter sp. P9b]|uniref:Murein hydrolase (TIGR00659 family) n=1 Tax=Aminobacter niigataensis TaxID=83265 RepID=A0ABR6L6Y8_9HYPH|nr:MULTISPECIES: LrgB family protein [Aminobacter]AWC25694.1 Inner membrane protein YohK [Aminobacter sp. MSH1]MBB4652569.1 putative murein hydrolase (TIGR00659 family) [Aminobacter niigataensis]CAI2936348.1 Inner membrane protein YohK [Aminobacter niigataensis]